MKYQFVRPFAWSVIALLVLTATAWGETLTEIPTSAAADVEFRGISPDDFTAIFFNQRQLGGTFFEQPYTSPIDFYLECWDETYPYKSCKLVPDLEDGTDYSIFWEGWLYVPESGKYTFFFENVDDGAMLLLDEDRIVEMGWFYPDPDTKPSPQEVWLDARWYRLKVFYEQRIHYVASFSLRWSGPGFEEEVIPVMPAGIRPDAISPTDWISVLSLRPTFVWNEVPGATSYILQIFYASYNENLETDRGELAKKVTLTLDDVICQDEKCSFKPGFPNPKLSDIPRFELTSQIEPPDNAMTDPPRGEGLLGYQWEVKAIVIDRTITGKPGDFQIPPLGLWERVEDYTCKTYKYCSELGYQGGYWNYYDDSFYRWGEIFDVPPHIMKAITYGETASGLGPRLINDRWFPPERAYLYEPGEDFENGGTCDEDCSNFLIENHTPTIMPYEFTILKNISIWNFVDTYGFRNLDGFKSKIPGCDKSTSSRCQQNTSRAAQYTVFASYGLGQPTFISAWRTLKNISLGVLLPPEALYDPDYNIRALAAMLGFDKRCRTVKTKPEPPYPSADSSFESWKDSIGKYNSGGKDYYPIVEGRLNHTRPDEQFGVLYEMGEKQSVERLVRMLVDRYPDCSYCCWTGEEPFRNEVIRYLNRLGVPAPSETSSLSETMAFSSMSSTQSQQEPLATEIAAMEVDLKGVGSTVIVTLWLDGFPQIGKAGVVRIYSDDTRQTLLWESEPVADNVLDNAFLIPIQNPATGRLMMLTEWVEGFHSSRTYPLQWDGGAFRLIPAVGSDGEPVDGIFSDGGGLFMSRDGSLMAYLQDYVSYEHRYVDVYTFDGSAYQKRRTYFIDQGVEDVTPPETLITLDPLPGASGWNQAPTTATLEALDENDVRAINYSLSLDAATQTRYIPLDEVEISMDEGRWSLSYYAIDVYYNEESEKHTEVLIDTTPPATNIVLHGLATQGGLFFTPVEVTLEATDPLLGDGSEGSGVEQTQFSLDGGTTWQTYVAPFVISTHGQNVLLYRSGDFAGNFENEKSRSIPISFLRWNDFCRRWLDDGDFQHGSSRFRRHGRQAHPGHLWPWQRSPLYPIPVEPKCGDRPGGSHQGSHRRSF